MAAYLPDRASFTPPMDRRMSLEPEILEAKLLPDGTYYVQYAGWRDETRRAQGRGDQQFRRPDGGTITADLITDHRIQVPPIGRELVTRVNGGGRIQVHHLPTNRWLPLDSYAGPLSDLEYREWQIDVMTELVEPAMRRFAERTRRIDRWGDRRGTTLNLIVGASLADTSESEGTAAVTATQTYVAKKANTSASLKRHGLLHFTGATVPQGATINSASLTLKPQSTLYDDVDGAVYCEDADEAAIGTTTNGDVTGRAKTTANTAWSADAMGTGDVSVDVTPAVQEVIDRAGFTESTINVLLTPSSAVIKELRAVAYDSSTVNCARLDIDYTAGGGTSVVPLLEGGMLRGGFQDMTGGL